MAVRGAAVDRVGALRAAAGLAGLFPSIIVVLAVAGLVELTLMRIFYRVGVFLPKDGGFRGAYAALTEVGSFAFNLASVLALVGLAVLLVVAVQRRRTAVAMSAGVFLLASVMAAAGDAGLRPAVRVAFVLSAVAVVWPMLRRGGPSGVRLLVGAVAAAVLASSYAGFTADAQVLAPGGAASAGAVPAQLIGEALVVVAALAAAAAWAVEGPRRWGPAVAGLVAALTLVAAWQANGSIAGILVLWTAGLRLYLPVWIYGLALGAAVAAAVGWRRSAPWRSAGLILLLVAGFLLESTYQQALALLALVLLTDGAAIDGLPGWRSAAVRAPEADRAA